MRVKPFIPIVGILVLICLTVILSGCTGTQNVPTCRVQIYGSNYTFIYHDPTNGTSKTVFISNSVVRYLMGKEIYQDSITPINSFTPINNTGNMSLEITNISVDTPGFTLQMVTPKLPILIAPGYSRVVTMWVIPPDEDFSGHVNYTWNIIYVNKTY